MKMNPVMEDFYKSSLAFGCLTVQPDGSITRDLDEGEHVLTSDKKPLYLPYIEVLEQPTGKRFFHPLNENFNKPESEPYNLFVNNTTLALNIKLLQLMLRMIEISSDTNKQKQIKNRKLKTIIENMGDVDMSVAETLQKKVFPKATKQRGVSPFVKFYVKRNGQLNGQDFSAVGKVNFVLFKELEGALNNPNKTYEVYEGTKLRVKDINGLIGVMNAIFPQVQDENVWSTGVNNNVFRTLDCFLRTAYMVAFRMNEICDMLGEDLDEQELFNVCKSELSWVDMLESLYDMRNVIRAIQNQDDVQAEAVQQVQANTAKVTSAPKYNPSQADMNQVYTPNMQPNTTAPTFQPPPVQMNNNVNQMNQQMQQPQQQGQQPKPSVEDLLRGAQPSQDQHMQMNPGMYGQMGMMGGMGMMQPGMMNMGMQQMNHTPEWMIQMEMKRQQTQQPQPNPQMQPNMGMGYGVQPGMQPGMGMQQPQTNFYVNPMGQTMNPAQMQQAMISNEVQRRQMAEAMRVQQMQGAQRFGMGMQPGVQGGMNPMMGGMGVMQQGMNPMMGMNGFNGMRPQGVGVY